MNYGELSIKRHRETKGKVAIVSKMPLETIEDLSVAYTPGVAAVSLAIAAEKSLSFELTNRANTVAVVSDGTAVLGIGDQGPLGAMPVMEGKAILFKNLAGVDAIPICLDTKDPAEIVKTVRYLAPSFGGINLEDIAAPKCFEVEEALQDLGIPVFHDDQHGTAVVTLGGLINALAITGKKIKDVKIVMSGAGAAGWATTKILLDSGARDITLVDTKGTIHKGRTDLTPVKKKMLEVTNPRDIRGGIADALKGADVFIGVSAAGIVTPEMVRSMNKDPIIFAMANPVPEIMPDLAKKAGAAIVGTGRSDFANQINNCLAFPGIFRGALDVRAPRITSRMKVEAAKALAALVKRPTPEKVIPWALDKTVVPAVAQAVRDAWKSEAKGKVAVAGKAASAARGKA
ncbi:MAG: NADP-dependent malic enzyme [Chloroflexi bacterium]|nr:NADP-dependent malic enzyme [Chloroflexota bacterium]